MCKNVDSNMVTFCVKLVNLAKYDKMMMSDMSDDNFDGCDAEVGFQMGAKYRV